jgi:hypothetical protein
LQDEQRCQVEPQGDPAWRDKPGGRRSFGSRRKESVGQVAGWLGRLVPHRELDSNPQMVGSVELDKTGAGPLDLGFELGESLQATFQPD